MKILQKSFLVQLFSIIVILFVSGCSSDDTSSEGTLTVSKKLMSVSASDYAGVPVEINASGNWTAKVSDSWVLLSQSTGEAGTTTLKIYVDNSAMDEAIDSHEGKVTLSLDDNSEVIEEITLTHEEENSADGPLIMVDNGHGVETPGKRSPDGRLREYSYTRELADRVIKNLQESGINAIRLVPEDSDVPLMDRVSRVNKQYSLNNKAILVSIHVNSAGDGSAWMSERGWSVFVNENPDGKSITLATKLADVAKSAGIKVRTEEASRNYWVASRYLLKNINCPGIMVENWFMDNKEDVDYLLSENGKITLTRIIVDGVKAYLETEK